MWLSAPAFGTLAARTGAWRALRPQLVPGIVGALLGGLVLLAFRQRAPSAVTERGRQRLRSVAADRVLYGGITEAAAAALGRDDAATLAVRAGRDVASRVPARSRRHPAIAGSALLFELGHLPTIVAYGGTLTAEVVLWTLVGNALFGVVAGVLFPAPRPPRPR